MTPIQSAWEGLANAMRLYVENRFRAPELLRVDPEEAVNNLDRAFETKLEKFHTLYDVTKDLPGFQYMSHGDTSLLIALRNAIHHRDHQLFTSWNAQVWLQNGMHKFAGQKFLLGSLTPDEDPQTARFYYRLQDFYARLTSPNVKRPEALRVSWNAELKFDELAQAGESQGYLQSHVYVDVMPIFMAAICRVVEWLDAMDFVPAGFDGETYFDHFGKLVLPTELTFLSRELPPIPQH